MHLCAVCDSHFIAKLKSSTWYSCTHTNYPRTSPNMASSPCFAHPTLFSCWTTVHHGVDGRGKCDHARTKSRPRRRPRPTLCAEPNNSPPSTKQFGVLTDSILELKWRNEKLHAAHNEGEPYPTASSVSSARAVTVSPKESCGSCDGTATDDLCASDPYKAFAHFTRLAAPTAALGRDDAPLSPDLAPILDPGSPYSAASITQRLMRYSYSRKNLAEFVSLFQGEFDNYDQIATERGAGLLPGDGGGHEHIHCSISQISPDLLFARYYFNGDPSCVFRSRLYHVSASDSSERGIVEMRIFRFYEETERELKRNNYDIGGIEWDEGDVYDWLAGCEVYWEHYAPHGDDEAGRLLGIQAGPRFVGYMKGGGCEFYSREIGGRIRVMDDLLLTSEELWVADRGFDEEDNFVYGNRRGVPYKMRRIRAGDKDDWTLCTEKGAPEGYCC